MDNEIIENRGFREVSKIPIFINRRDEKQMDMWDSVLIKKVELKNRIVRSATNEHLGTLEGEMTKDYIKVYETLAKSGIGLLITSHMAIDKTQRADITHICVNEEKNREKLKDLAAKVHQYGAKIIVQLSSGGYRAKNVAGQEAKSPSDMDGSKAMTASEIKECVENYVEAVRTVKETGFDGVQIHLAHGYLLSEFLDPFYNKRQDEYGGNVQNRYRIIHEIMLAIQDLINDDFLITVKIDTIDKEENETFLQDQIQVCKWLERDGVDAIEISRK